MKEQTTIRVYKNTKQHLESFRIVPEESLDHVLRRMLHVLDDLLDDTINVHTKETIRNKLLNAHAKVSKKEIKKKMFKYEV